MSGHLQEAKEVKQREHARANGRLQGVQRRLRRRDPDTAPGQAARRAAAMNH